jgi:hypothetical protein
MVEAVSSQQTGRSPSLIAIVTNLLHHYSNNINSNIDRGHWEINIITLTANTLATPIAIMIILTTTTDSLPLLLRQMTIMMTNI